MNANRCALLVMGLGTGYLIGDEPNASSGEWLELKSSRTGGDRASHINLLREAHATLKRDGKAPEPTPAQPADTPKAANGTGA